MARDAGAGDAAGFGVDCGGVVAESVEAGQLPAEVGAAGEGALTAAGGGEALAPGALGLVVIETSWEPPGMGPAGWARQDPGGVTAPW